MKLQINGNEYDIKPFADLTDACLHNAVLTDAELLRAVLRRAVLRGANLRNADFTGADLIGADLTEADLTEADLTGAYFTDAIGIVTAGGDWRGFVFYKQLKGGVEVYGAGCHVWLSYEDAIAHYADDYDSNGDPDECIALIDKLKDMSIKTETEGVS